MTLEILFHELAVRARGQQRGAEKGVGDEAIGKWSGIMGWRENRRVWRRLGVA